MSIGASRGLQSAAVSSIHETCELYPRWFSVNLAALISAVHVPILKRHIYNGSYDGINIHEYNHEHGDDTMDVLHGYNLPLVLAD